MLKEPKTGAKTGAKTYRPTIKKGRSIKNLVKMCVEMVKMCVEMVKMCVECVEIVLISGSSHLFVA
jgi:hypothetical protein